MKFSEMTSIAHLEDLLQKFLNETKEAAIEFSEKKTRYEDLASKEKPLLASLFLKKDGAIEIRKKEAEASEEYSTFLEGLSAARGEFLIAEVHYKMGLVNIDSIRSVISTRRDEIKRFQG